MNTKDILQGIKDWAAPKVIYDISAAHNNTKYTDLSNALGTNGDNIPQEYRKGGITVRYVQSSDNKYVQFRLMSDSFNTTVANWQGVDDKPTAGSNNLVKSGGVFSSLALDIEIDQKYLWKSSGLREYNDNPNYYATKKISVIAGMKYTLAADIRFDIMGSGCSVWLNEREELVSILYTNQTTPNLTKENPVDVIAPENAAYLGISAASPNISVSLSAKNNDVNFGILNNKIDRYNDELITSISSSGNGWYPDGTIHNVGGTYVCTEKIPVIGGQNYVLRGNINFAILGGCVSLWFKGDEVLEILYTNTYPGDNITPQNPAIIKAPNDATHVAITFTGYSTASSLREDVLASNRQNSADINDILETATLKADKKIICWGDSLTEGAGGEGTTYPSVLQTLVGSGYVVENYGHGGETAEAISVRKGSMPILISPCTIPHNDWVRVSFKAVNGLTTRTLYSNQYGTQGINNIVIDGVKYMFRSITGEYDVADLYNYGDSDVVIDRPKLAFAEGDGDKHIMLVCMGQNGYCYDKGAKNNIDGMIELCDGMIDKNRTCQYIIMSPPTLDAEYWAELESRMGSKYGKNFLNAREYISKYGLLDNGLTPTQEDTEAMAIGAIPPQLRVDAVHLTAAGYSSFAKCVYQRGKELGYWE